MHYRRGRGDHVAEFDGILAKGELREFREMGDADAVLEDKVGFAERHSK